MNKLKKNWKIPIGLAFIVTMLWAGSYLAISKLNLENIGVFGDSFGAINALFSGLAFAGLIYTIILQMHELELTREELRKSSKAQDLSQKALAEQVLQMEKSAKLSALASLVEYHSTVANGFTAWKDYKSFSSEFEKAKPYIEEIKKITDIQAG